MKRIYHIEPIYKSFVWGGRKLIEKYNIKTNLDNIGTIYHVIAIPGHLDNTVIEAGEPLSQFYKNHPRLFNCTEKIFPVRMTTTCNEGNQSYQLHPDDAYAMEHEGTKGKVSGNIVLESTGKVRRKFFGHTAKTLDGFKEMVENKNWDKLFQKIDVPDGDFLNTPAGVVHGGKGDGTIMATYATNSDITYRFYDFDRNDPNRPLHLNQVFDCVNIPEAPVGPIHVEPLEKDGIKLYEYYSKPKEYVAKRIIVDGKGSYEYSSFLFLACVNGEGSIDSIGIKPGETLFIPAGYGPVELTGRMDLIVLSYIGLNQA